VRRREEGGSAGLDELGEVADRHHVDKGSGVASCGAVRETGTSPEYVMLIEVAEDEEGVVGGQREEGGEESFEGLDCFVVGFWRVVNTKYMYSMGR
jgi:hypothetical protein